MERHLTAMLSRFNMVCRDTIPLMLDAMRPDNDGKSSRLWATPDFDGIRAAAATGTSRRKVTVVLPLHGLLEHTQSFYGWAMGGTDLQVWGSVFDSLVSNDGVKSIVIDANTPGGTAAGTPEAAAKVYAARGTKPIFAVVNPMMASAGYYIGSAADRVFVTPSGEAGSIGTVMIHEDMSKMLEKMGVNITVIKAGEHKYEGHPFGPLPDGTLEHFQHEVNDTNATFHEAVAKHRGVTAGTVKKDFGDGRMFSAKAAVERNMADKVATLEQVARRADAGLIDVSQSREQLAIEDWSMAIRMDEPRGMSAEFLRRKLEFARR